jgi:hypothetical protein
MWSMYGWSKCQLAFTAGCEQECDGDQDQSVGPTAWGSKKSPRLVVLGPGGGYGDALAMPQ